MKLTININYAAGLQLRMSGVQANACLMGQLRSAKGFINYMR